MTALPLIFKPGPVRLAAAAELAGFSRSVTYPSFTDDCGHHWTNPSAALLAVAVCAGESSGNAWVYHVNYPGSAQQSIDYGLWEINQSYNQNYFSAVTSPTQLNWENHLDNAKMAYAIWDRAHTLRVKGNLDPADDWAPWHAYSGGLYKAERYNGKSWMDWAYYGITKAAELVAENPGWNLYNVANVNLDPLEYGSGVTTF